MGSCLSSSTVPGCVLYGPTGQCFSCQPTFTITNGQCVKDSTACLAYDPSDSTSCIACGFGTVLQNKVCVGVINCNTTQINCQGCILGFNLVGNKCVDNTGNCNVVGGNGVCVTCKSGFTLVGYTCMTTNTTDYGCYIYTNASNCLACKSGYNPY